MVLVGITHTDTEVDADYLVPKLLNLKLWGDSSKPWSKSLIDMNYQLLLVSQFTLYHQLKGTKPDFHDAMAGEQAKILYDYFLDNLARTYGKPEKVFPGAFGEYMNIEMVNDGPVTLVVDSIKDPKLQKKWENVQKRKQK